MQRIIFLYLFGKNTLNIVFVIVCERHTVIDSRNKMLIRQEKRICIERMCQSTSVKANNSKIKAK